MRPKVQQGRRPSLVCWDCQKVTRVMEPVDEFVTEVILQRLERLDLDLADPEGGTAHASAVADRDALLARLDELADAMAAGEMPVRVASRASAQVQQQLDLAERRVVATAPNPVLHAACGAGARQAWAAMDLQAQRQVLRDLCASVVIAATGPGIKFSEDQVQITWKGEQPSR